MWAIVSRIEQKPVSKVRGLCYGVVRILWERILTFSDQFNIGDRTILKLWFCFRAKCHISLIIARLITCCTLKLPFFVSEGESITKIPIHALCADSEPVSEIAAAARFHFFLDFAVPKEAVLENFHPMPRSVEGRTLALPIAQIQVHDWLWLPLLCDVLKVLHLLLHGV